MSYTVVLCVSSMHGNLSQLAGSYPELLHAIINTTLVLVGTFIQSECHQIPWHVFNPAAWPVGLNRSLGPANFRRQLLKNQQTLATVQVSRSTVSRSPPSPFKTRKVSCHCAPSASSGARAPLRAPILVIPKWLFVKKTKNLCFLLFFFIPNPLSLLPKLSRVVTVV
jgi:hypothetical protein